METSVPPLTDILSSMHWWRIHTDERDRTKSVECEIPVEDGVCTLHYPFTALTTLHPSLPEDLLQLTTVYEKSATSQGRFAPYYLQCVIAHRLAPLPAPAPYGSLAVTEILELTGPVGSALVERWSANVMSYQAPGRITHKKRSLFAKDVTPGITSIGIRNMELSTAWLDTHYPDWRMRLLAATVLGTSNFIRGPLIFPPAWQTNGMDLLVQAEERYPGWQERLKVAQALDMSDRERLHYLRQVSAPPDPVATLDAVNFDIIQFPGGLG